MDNKFLSGALGPLPETDESHPNYHGSCEEAFTYSANAMEVERKRCYLLGVKAGQDGLTELMHTVDFMVKVFGNRDHIFSQRFAIDNAKTALSKAKYPASFVESKEITPAEFKLRGMLASKLKFWHLLKEEEAQSVVAVFEEVLSQAKSKEAV
jgi:hypothetical protein